MEPASRVLTPVRLGLSVSSQSRIFSVQFHSRAANEIQRKDCFGAMPKAQAALLVGQANFLNEFLEAFVRAERVEHRYRLEINHMLRVFCVNLLQ